jgi:hypothetical protein
MACASAATFSDNDSSAIGFIHPLHLSASIAAMFATKAGDERH